MEAMRQNRDIKYKGQPQSVTFLLFFVFVQTHTISFSGFLLLTVTVFPVAMVTFVAEHCKDAVALLNISREKPHLLIHS